ncbi:peptidase T [Rhizobium sp. Root274]|uniref:peptidase T n=1 Tax=unclassified Rhizobium TaxID=2613769 RepID=UPI0007125D06|nr:MULTISPECIES: peptidase T [unclassified Rhizobium]KQW28680.1 peptidase T [Rhizobium sp. Root1240]KRD28879.1 peptidase T [Rhizobium sp. Root274]
MTDTVLDRFLRYVVIDTQSDPTSSAQPSTEKQKDLGRRLTSELLALGLSDAHLDEHGNVYATIPANTTKDVPVICFCSHMDTAPDFTGTNVRPQILSNYQGGDIALPGDSGQVIRVEAHPQLKGQIGNDIVTTDGTTLLGADDKAGIAEIMTAAAHLLASPDIRHGTIKILFTTDEEIGRGADKVNLEKLGAHFAYTLDGSTVGEIENETFSADGVTIDITGVAMHPGYAKGKMENAIKIASDIVARLPRDIAPETTDGRAGFIHPVDLSGSMESAHLQLIIRDFDDQGLAEKEALLKAIAEDVLSGYPGSTTTFTVKHQYRNMKQVLDRHPEIMDNLAEAVRRVGLEPVLHSIRGGTDGSRLSFMGLPCPNIYTGGHAYHSPLEWVSVQDMEKAVETIVALVQVWEERAA